MAGHAAGSQVALTGTITELNGDVAVVKVDGSIPAGGTIIVRLSRPDDDGPSDEDRIRDAMAGAQDHPGQVITR